MVKVFTKLIIIIEKIASSVVKSEIFLLDL